MELEHFVADFASAVEVADSKRPQARNYRPGIGPHTEAQSLALIRDELQTAHPDRYAGRLKAEVPYPTNPRLHCDIALDDSESLAWAIEAKMLRLLGDNGKPNDNLLTHILSPYPAHRSALTDCEKLAKSAFPRRRAILIFGYHADDWPLELAIGAFETLARTHASLGVRHQADFKGLVHPVHRCGKVYAWELH